LLLPLLLLLFPRASFVFAQYSDGAAMCFVRKAGRLQVSLVFGSRLYSALLRDSCGFLLRSACGLRPRSSFSCLPFTLHPRAKGRH